MANNILGIGKALSIEAACDGVNLRRQKTEHASENIVRSIIRNRSQRWNFFPKSLFADPAWDILLELYAAQLNQIRVTVTGLSIASNVPPSTAMRWIRILEDEDLIERANDRLDARRYYVSLSETGAQAMAGYFASLPENTPAVFDAL